MIQASRFDFQILRIGSQADTIGSFPNKMGVKYTVFIIDVFTRYVDLTKQEVVAIAVTDALWRHTSLFTVPLEIVTIMN